ncbi:HET-domain-containing protein [Daedaleopsis nitida]|nr:HET-domain-containing protein [Daedaleopsis nitida]
MNPQRGWTLSSSPLYTPHSFCSGTMPCFPPLCLPVRRYVRGLFKRGGIPASGASSNLEGSSPSEGPEATKRNSVAGKGEAVSLVCGFCWDTGLFAPGPFQKAWNAQLAYTGFTYSTTWSQVQLSSEGGCHWCKLLLAARTEAVAQETLEVTVGFRTLRLLIGDTPHSMYYVSADPEDPAAAVIVSRPPIVKLNSPTTHSLATNCLTDCIRKHPRCPAPHTPTLPTRVIDCADPSKPVLHLSNGERAPYLALSYVRGVQDLLATTTKNIDTFLHGIEVGRIPQTIKDAINTAHAHGVRYLWVDSLCILQDSEADRVREISEIRAIYRNAYFTIVAASSHNVNEGFLHDRQASPLDVVLPFRCPDGQVGTMSLSPVWRQYDGSTEPINQRGWCLQERLLSPRALVYASHTLQYQCRTSTYNVGNAVCGPIVGQRLPDLLYRADAEPPTKLSTSDLNTLRWAWVEVVGEYTRRAVSEPGDKLVAFAGIADLFHRVWQSDYLAGLWRATLVQDLLWYKNFETRFPRPAGYRAPSWSWAAIDGHVLAATMDDRLAMDDSSSCDVETCEIVSCEATAATPTVPFGGVSAGTLHLRAVILEAIWNPDSAMPDLYLQPPSHGPSDSPVEPVYIGCAYPDSEEEMQDVFAVPMLWNTSAQYAAGLIVAPTEENGKYRRLGYFHSPEDALVGLTWMTGREMQDIVLV